MLKNTTTRDGHRVIIDRNDTTAVVKVTDRLTGNILLFQEVEARNGTLQYVERTLANMTRVRQDWADAGYWS